MSSIYKNPKSYISSVSVNCILFGYTNEELVVLLEKDISVETSKKIVYSLPEDLVGETENLDEAAHRIINKQGKISNLQLSQFHAFGNPNRLKDEKDKKWISENAESYGKRVIAISYYAILNLVENKYDDFKINNAEWYPVRKLPNLAIDHAEIIQSALDYLRTSFINFQTKYSYLLPKKFTLSSLQNLYEVILGKKMDKRNFRKAIHDKPFLKQLKSLEKGLAHRPARLYSYKKVSL